MYRRLLDKAIGTACGEITCLLFKHERVYILPGGPGVTTQYCPEMKRTYVTIYDSPTTLPLRGCGRPEQGLSPLKKIHLPSTD